MIELFKIAARNVLRNRRRSLISLFGIFLGMMAVVGIHGFMLGTQRSIISGTVDSRLGALQVHRAGYLASLEAAPLTLDIANAPELAARLRALPHVTGVTTRIQFPIMVNKGDETVFAFATGIDPENEYVVCPEQPEIVTAGTPLADGPGMLMSATLAESLGAEVGDLITLLGNDRDGALNGIEVPLRGLYLGKFPGMENTIMVSLAEAQTLLRMDDRVTEIAIGLDSVAYTPEVTAAVEAAVGAELEVHTWQQLAPNIVDIMEFQGTFITIASVLFAVVALTIIVNTMLMTVLERVREIGTMLALGLRRWRVVTLFLMESAVLGLLGGIAGGGAGWLIVLYMGVVGIEIGAPGMDTGNVVLPYVPASFVIAAALIASAGAVVAAVYPAIRASRLRPVEALRHV